MILLCFITKEYHPETGKRIIKNVLGKTQAECKAKLSAAMEAMRKGLFKKYIRYRYNNGNVKGTIDVARHIEKNTPFVGNVAYSQREFSYDNCLMELVRHTIEFVKRKTYGNNLLVKVKDEVNLVVDATPG